MLARPASTGSFSSPSPARQCDLTGIEPGQPGAQRVPGARGSLADRFHRNNAKSRFRAERAKLGADFAVPVEALKDPSATMATIDAFHMVSAFLAAFVAGAINSVAGGGAQITFPALSCLGIPA